MGIGALRNRARCPRASAWKKMTFDLTALDCIKLALGLGAFVFLVVIGQRSRRLTGVLLTFPILNGIALISSHEPFRVASAIDPLVMFNSLLFWLAVTHVDRLPPWSTGWPEWIAL